jgi:bifunctional non-homologous end joining protein LigD
VAEQRIRVQVGGVHLELSNLDKILYPAAGFTKGEVIDYYTRIAPVILPHLVGRPLTRIRYPNGVAAQGFFEKNKPNSTPDWVRTAHLPVPGSSTGRATMDFVVVEKLETLVWLANLAALELHVPQWTLKAPAPARAPRKGRTEQNAQEEQEKPNRLVVDLDPGPPAGLAECAEVALLLRDRLAADGLVAYPKTSGRKGMQLMCRLDGAESAEQVSEYAHAVADELARAHPKLVVSRMAKNLRPRKVFIDWSQNAAAKTTVAPYSLRAEPTPTVSTPLTWDEVASGAVRQFTAAQVLSRVDEHGDLMADLVS